MNFDLIYADVAGDRPYKRRDLDGVEGIMIHRVGIDHGTGVDFGPTAEEICREFTGGRAAPYTGSKVPYTFIVQKDARIAQALPLTWIGPHALKLSRKFVSVALVGDFRASPRAPTEEPTDGQFCATVFLLRGLLGVLCRPVTTIVGHTDPKMVKRGSTKDRRKKCPGEGVDLYKLRSAVSGGFAL